LVDVFDKTRLVVDLASKDFEHLLRYLATSRGSVAQGNEMQRVRVVFNYDVDAGLIDRAVRFGPIFKRPSRKGLRIERLAAIRGTKLPSITSWATHATTGYARAVSASRTVACAA